MTSRGWRLLDLKQKRSGSETRASGSGRGRERERFKLEETTSFRRIVGRTHLESDYKSLTSFDHWLSFIFVWWKILTSLSKSRRSFWFGIPRDLRSEISIGFPRLFGKEKNVSRIGESAQESEWEENSFENFYGNLEDWKDYLQKSADQHTFGGSVIFQTVEIEEKWLKRVSDFRKLFFERTRLLWTLSSHLNVRTKISCFVRSCHANVCTKKINSQTCEIRQSYRQKRMRDLTYPHHNPSPPIEESLEVPL